MLHVAHGLKDLTPIDDFYLDALIRLAQLGRSGPARAIFAIFVQPDFAKLVRELSDSYRSVVPGLQVRDLTAEINHLARTIAFADLVLQLPTSHIGLASPAGKDISDAQTRVTVRHLSYASPLEVTLVVPAAILASGPALTVLIFGLKRLYGLDLEFRTYREDHRAAFYEAKTHAAHARSAWRATGPDRSEPPLLSEELIASIDRLVRENPPVLRVRDLERPLAESCG